MSAATIRARTNCTCTRAWFDCRCDAEETVYDASGHPWTIEDTPIPSPAFVAYVAKMHPGATLVHIQGPAYLAAEYAAAMASF